ncbi:hypothetical protein [Thermomonospora amylolytica]|uniref:hypothetical protein n=1 Tax=Thermomonospora amylolytica TaxID=1411117 RepID=UPI0018E57CFD|nr:hypothetical protein [Thermomonospora amylolytica]
MEGASAAEDEAARPSGDFLRAFAGGDTWKAMLVVADGVFAGTGVRGALTLRVDEALGDGTDPAYAYPEVPFPVWTGASGLVLDLSARFAGTRVRVLGGDAARGDVEGWTALGVRSGGRAGFRQRHHGVLVIDTLNPRSLYRPFGGPARPNDEPIGPEAVGEAAEGPDAGVVIVADLREAGVRVLDAAALWRYACRTVTTALYDPRTPATWEQTRRELRGLRHVGCIDPGLGLGLVIHLDADRRPWCPLGFLIDEDPATGQAAARLLRP